MCVCVRVYVHWVYTCFTLFLPLETMSIVFPWFSKEFAIQNRSFILQECSPIKQESRFHWTKKNLSIILCFASMVFNLWKAETGHPQLWGSSTVFSPMLITEYNAPRLFLCLKIPHVHTLAQIKNVSITFIYILFCIMYPHSYSYFLAQNWPQNASQGIYIPVCANLYSLEQLGEF